MIPPRGSPAPRDRLALLVEGGLPRGPDSPASLVGLEHEYVLRRGETKVDFRSLIHALPVDGLRLDPGDINAYRCASGMVLTCDDAEAEIASPPLPVSPRFPERVVEWSTFGGQELGRLLAGTAEVEGYSTHLSAAMPSNINDAVCSLYARTFAPALMLLIDRPDSHGIFIRPRPARAEFCGEFVTGDRLAATAAFVAGSARACANAVARGHPGASGALPPELRASPGSAPDRFGLYLPRTAFGDDLYRNGRRTTLHRAGGGTITAQEQLESAWESARTALRGSASDADLATMDRIVSGADGLGVEGQQETAASCHEPPPGNVLGAVTSARARAGFTVACAAATWDWSLFRLASGSRQAYLLIPRRPLARFLELLDAGDLDEVLLACLDAPGETILASHAQTREVGVFSAVGPTAGLLAPEREPSTSAALELSTAARAVEAAAAIEGATRPGKRPGKRSTPVPPETVPAPPPPPSLPLRRAWRRPLMPLVVTLGALVLLAGGVTTVVVATNNGGGPSPSPTATSGSPNAESPQSGATTTTAPSRTAPGGASPTATATCAPNADCPGTSPVPSQTVQGGSGCPSGPNCVNGTPVSPQASPTSPNQPPLQASPTATSGCTPGPNCPNGTPLPGPTPSPTSANPPPVQPTPTATEGCTPGPNCPNGTPLPQPTATATTPSQPPPQPTPTPTSPNQPPPQPTPTPTPTSPNQPPPQPTPTQCIPGPNDPCQ
ncbi:MAG: hypothetical protein HY875_15215 [Chloroflexi bacterium]|nr:hypothetical protein [Chloroflexota bacterium]